MCCDPSATDLKSFKIFISKYENKHMQAEETRIMLTATDLLLTGWKKEKWNKCGY